MKVAASPRSMTRSQLFWHSLSHIRRFSPLRMTKRGDARRSVDRRFSSYRPPSPQGEGAPKGRIGHWRYEREREGASQVDDLRKHPSAADAVPLPRWGRQISSGYAAILRLRSQLFWHSLSHIRRFSPLRMTKRGDARRSVDRRFSSYRQPSPRGEGAPKGRIGHWRYEREREGASQVDDLRKHPSAVEAVPLPRWGRLRGVTLRRDPSTQFSYFR